MTEVSSDLRKLRTSTHTLNTTLNPPQPAVTAGYAMNATTVADWQSKAVIESMHFPGPRCTTITLAAVIHRGRATIVK